MRKILLTSILKGFRLNWIRPTGGGRYGSMLGFSRPLPTSRFLATSRGMMRRSMRHLMGLPSLYVVRMKLSSSLNSSEVPGGIFFLRKAS